MLFLFLFLSAPAGNYYYYYYCIWQMSSPADWARDVGMYAPCAAYSNRCFVVACNQAGDVADTLGAAPLGRWHVSLPATTLLG